VSESKYPGLPGLASKYAPENAKTDVGEKSALGIPPALELDPADYLPDMAGFAMDEAEKIELLNTLWNVMRRVVEMNVDIGELDLCGRFFGAGEENPASALNDVKSTVPRNTEMQANDEKEEHPA
jgi:hypothetical protein